MAAIHRQVPPKLLPLLENETADGTPVRNKALHGGRGGAKSHFFAEQLIIEGYTGVPGESECEPLRAVCIREIQKTLKESVHQLLVDKIQKFNLGKVFDVQDRVIKCPRGGEIIFQGMQTHTAESIKSIEGMNRAWREEAQTISAHSDKLLRPTIRRPRSQIWDSWNPRHDTDPVDVYHRGKRKNPRSIVVEINWQDNPWFADPLLSEMRDDYEDDPEEAEHIWGGGYQIISEGAYYARLIAHAEKQGRVGNFPHDPSRPVITAWDIGIDDYTAVWFCQIDPDHRGGTVIDFYESSGEGVDDVASVMLPELFVPPSYDDRFVGWSSSAQLAELERDPPYKYGQHFLPHDVKVREWGSGARSRIQIMQALGFKNIKKGALQGPAERVAATRRILPVMKFDNNPRVQAGLKRLRRYRRKYNDTLQTYTTPEKDGNDHGADAFGEFAINCQIRPPKPKPEKRPDHTEYVARDDGLVIANVGVSDLIRQKQRAEKTW